MKDATALHWISSDWVGSADSAEAETTNPAIGVPVQRFAAGGRPEAEAAIAAARQAFDRGEWAESPRLRAAVLLAFADRIEACKRALAQILTEENGKVLNHAELEITAVASELRYYAGLARNIAGKVLEIAPRTLSVLHREAAGVAAHIVPWNAPGILLVRSLGPAMAAGCTNVIKPAPQVAGFHTAIMRCLADIEAMPAGVVNSVMETGSVIGKILVESPDVEVVSFTGSTAVGQRIMAAAAGTLKRLVLELGGKAPCVVFDDVSVDTVAPALAAAATVISGQQCTAAARVLVQRNIYEDLRNALAKRFREMVVGPGTDPASEMGPLIDRASRDRVAAVVDRAAAEGRIIVQGEIPGGSLAAGAFIRPSLTALEDLSSPLVCDEIFGPVLNIEPFDDEADAIRRANAVRYGLAASVWTRDHDRAQHVARALRAGTVWINAHNRLFPEAETGGYRASGVGRMHGVEGLDPFLETKHVYHEAAPSPSAE